MRAATSPRPCFAAPVAVAARPHASTALRPRIQPRRAPAPTPAASGRRAPTARLVPLPTGTDMEVLDAAPPAGTAAAADAPVLLFIHGSLHAAWAYRLFQPHFAALGFRTHAVSLRGAGATRQPQTTAVSVAQHVADLTALLAAPPLADAARVVLVAHSLGGFVAQKLVQTLPGAALRRVAGLVLLASTPPAGNNALVWRTLRAHGLRLSWRITMCFVRGTAARERAVCREMFFSPVDAPGFDAAVEGDDVLDGVMPLLAANALSTDMKSLADQVAPRDDGLTVPTLSVGGSRDYIVDEVGVRESADMWRGEARMVDGAPHDIMLYSGWRAVADDIAAWLADHVTAPSPPS